MMIQYLRGREQGFFCAKRKVEMKRFGHIMYIVFLTNRKDYKAVLLPRDKVKWRLVRLKRGVLGYRV